MAGQVTCLSHQQRQMTTAQTHQSLHPTHMAAWKRRMAGVALLRPQHEQTSARKPQTAGRTLLSPQQRKTAAPALQSLKQRQMAAWELTRASNHYRMECRQLPDTRCSHTRSQYGCGGQLCLGEPHLRDWHGCQGTTDTSHPYVGS